MASYTITLKSADGVEETFDCDEILNIIGEKFEKDVRNV